MDLIQNLILSNNHVFQIFIAIFIGLIVGLNKEITNQERKTNSLTGLRTFPLIVLFGTISTFFTETVLSLSFIFMIVVIGLAYFNGSFRLNRNGLTSELTIMIMFLIGILIGKNEILIALILTIIIAILNAYKGHFHNFAKKTTLTEWSGALQLIIISAIVLPFLPKTAIDPYNIFIPFKIWILVIFISSISFIGYFLTKYFSKGKSLFLTSFFGSLVSSTAVTISIAKDSKQIDPTKDIKNSSKSEHESKTNLYLIALILANVIMQIRVLLEVLIIGGFNKGSSSVSNSTNSTINELNINFFAENREFIFIFIPGLIIILYLAIRGIFLWQKHKKQTVIKKNNYNSIIKETDINTITDKTKKSPFELVPALKFAIFFIIMLFIVYFSGIWFGNIGTYFSSFIASTVDVEASILTALELVKNGKIDYKTLTGVVTISLITNTMIKVLYLYFFGNKKLAKKFLLIILPSMILAIIAFYILNFLI